MIYKLRNELYRCIEEYGISDEKTLKKAQELDVVIVEKQKTA
jgi:Spo0E like sporulation regulatory protein